MAEGGSVAAKLTTNVIFSRTNVLKSWTVEFQVFMSTSKKATKEECVRGGVMAPTK